MPRVGQAPSRRRDMASCPGGVDTLRRPPQPDKPGSEMKPSLAGRTILITGGTGGAGLEVARVLHEYGAEVVIGTRDADHYAEAAASLDKGGAVHPFIADLTDPRSIERGLGNLELEGVHPTDVLQATACGTEP